MDDRDRTLLAIRCNDETGLRLVDLLDLPKGAFVPSSGTLRVPLRHRARDVVRIFPLSRLLKLGLARMAADARPPEAPLFVDARGERLTPARIATLWAEGLPGRAGPGAQPLASLWAGDLASEYVAGRDAGVVRAALAEALASCPRPVVAEVGCAYGLFLKGLHRESLLPRNGTSIGIDRIAGTVQAIPGEGRQPGLHWVVGDASELPFPGRSLDALFAVGVLEHFPLPELFLEEASRCLRPGGVFIATTPNPLGLYARLARLRRWMQSFRPGGGLAALRNGYRPMVDPRETEKAVVHGHVSVFPPAVWRALLAGSGLRLESFRPITLILPNLAFTRHPGALRAVRRADALLANVPGLAGLFTSLCYVARKPV